MSMLGRPMFGRPMLTRRRPRALIAAGPERQIVFAALFTNQALSEWDTLPALSFGQARFMLQHQPCDIVLVSSDLTDREGSQGLAWLVGERRTPLIFLGDDGAGNAGAGNAGAACYLQAYDAGAAACLPRSLILAQPPLLERLMEHSLETRTAISSHERTRECLAESRRHIDRLVHMIWRTTPRHDDSWYPQSHMLERLDEEAARCRRHEVPLSVAVGELQSTDDGATTIPDWAADAIVRGKRRSDVVGQYGPNGFLILMTHTPQRGGITCCRRLQEVLEHPAEPPSGPHAQMRSYFGIAGASTEQAAPQSLLRIAEQNLEAARTQHESRVVAS